ncbi:MAG: membrane-bound O-acyltransferase family protein [Crocinitomicaceae bacterium]|nr:membrane-bound O-acyltransferase family protein [Crocinitomicaceae bacterium]
MLFNSIEFAVFLPLVFGLYWWVFNRNQTLRNAFLLVVSYVFYGWWDWRFLLLIAFSSLVDYSVGLFLSKTENQQQRKILLGISLFTNLGLLGFFKYYNFFIESFAEAFTVLGQPIQASRLAIILPVGISFYTFQTLSYSIDVYRKKLEPTTNFWAFFAFVSFFPQLVAGPIERATQLLPQFFTPKKFEYNTAVDGMRQILWGLFKKVVIADSCAVYVDWAFADAAHLPGSNLWIAAVLFAFQIYGDFSGYSDIAIGTAKLFGFRLMQNFAYPYFSRDIAEFWRRWHISLTTWFRDYVYIPLGGSRGNRWQTVRNTLVIFVVSGFWHGANWTFIVWGLLNALYFLPLILQQKNRRYLEAPALNSWKTPVQIAVTFFLTIIAWVFFRADTITQAMQILHQLFSTSVFTLQRFEGEFNVLITFVMIALLLVVEWRGRTRQYALEGLQFQPAAWKRKAVYLALIFAIGMFMETTETPFIYFQF